MPALAEVEAELARLRTAYDQAMSAFRFEEAARLQQRIAPLEQEQRRLAAATPGVAEPAVGTIPVLRRPVRHRRR